MKFTNVNALKMRTAELLEAVKEGEDVIITDRGKPKARLTRVDEEEIQMKEPKGKRKEGILRKNHPFFKLIAKGNDEARDVSANKYKYVGLTAEKKR